MDVTGKRVTVLGLGRHGGGVGAARYLAEAGAIVTVTDQADETALRESLSALATAPIHAYRLGGHRDEDICNADLVVVNPAVRPDHRLLRLAAESNVGLTSETELFLDACPAPYIAVTGSNGKSTTAAMTAAILEAAGRRTWLGGNIGGSLLGNLDAICPGDWVVLELSSFQLVRLSDRVAGPRVAIVTNCTPNHLDWHPDFDHYRSAKQRLLRLQSSGDAVVLNTSDEEVASWAPLAKGTIVPLAIDSVPDKLPVPGAHNRINAACAASAALAAGCSEDVVRRGLAGFRGLPHRLEFIAEIDGRRFYNDSLATTPESTIAALGSFDEPIWLLAGGSDKGCHFAPLAEAIRHRARGVAFYGACGSRLADAVADHGGHSACFVTRTMSEALNWCWPQTRRGHVVLLSPASASFDQFHDYDDRGRQFTKLVQGISQSGVSVGHV